MAGGCLIDPASRRGFVGRAIISPALDTRAVPPDADVRSRVDSRLLLAEMYLFSLFIAFVKRYLLEQCALHGLLERGTGGYGVRNVDNTRA